MKTLLTARRFLLLAAVGIAAIAQGASSPALDVTVSNSAGKLAYRGKTQADGTFTTPNLAPGDYVVQFSAKKSAQQGSLAVVISAGKKKVVAESVPASKFSQGGVAMKIAVDRGMNLTGQVVASGSSFASDAQGKSDGKVKYVNGKKYVWVVGALGSNIGGHWAEAGSVEAQNVKEYSNQSIVDLQQSRSAPPSR